MMNKGKFILIKNNADLVTYLRNRKFTCVGHNDATGVTTFLNDGILTFSEIESLNNKVVFTNTLTF